MFPLQMEVFLHLLPLIGALVFPVVLIHAIFWGMTFTVDEAHMRVRMYGLTVRKVAVSGYRVGRAGLGVLERALDEHRES